MSWERRLHRALDAHPDAPGTARVDGDGGAWAEVDVVRVDRIGVRVREVRVGHPPRDVAEEADRLAGALRDLPDRLAPVEVDRALGGAVLRTRPEDLRRREFFEATITPEQTTIRRARAGDDGREPAEFDLTREQLGRIVETIDGT